MAEQSHSDEDKLDERGQRRDPYFKCDWNYTLFLGHNLITHLGVYRTDIVRDIGGFRPEYDGAQDYDLALRFVERIAPDEIHHIPHVIYSWRITSGSTALSADEKPYAMMAGERALNDHFERTAQRASAHLIGFGCRIDYQLPNPLPLVTIIIPTRNNLALLKKCIESVRSLTSYKNFEIIVVDNGSDNSACLAYLNALAAQGAAQVIRDDRHFNYSALNNAAVRRAAGDVLCLLNDDIEVISRDWLDRMVSIAMQPMVGAVGAKLLYPDDTLQHGGVVMGLGGLAAHAHHRFPRLSPGYVARAALAQEFSAVTAACLVIQKRHYDAVQGLNEVDLTVAYNDIDFCLKLKHRGLKNIWTPFAELYHHESASRGYETTPEKQARFALEGAYMKKAWPDIIAHDPAYNPNLSINTADFALAFAPRVQKPWLHSLYANNQPQPEFDPVFYRAAYADLRTFTDEQMRAHWQARGVSEGRQGSLHAVRENFVNLALSEAPILEIGPFFRPCVTGVDVFYFDVLDQEQLNERAHRIGHANARAPFIQYVSPTGDLGVVDRKFRSVISSHCIEHQPCLVRHLDQVAALLDPAGRYFLLIPDKRYCFDHFIASTTLADVLQAYEEGRTAHTLASVIEHRALTTHNDTGRHWNGDHADPNYFDSRAERTRSAIAEYNQAAGQYIDVHAWQFTPHEFRELLVSLLGLGKSRFEVERVYETPLGRNEFCAVLRRT